jgi:carbonic anhydrase
MFKILVFMLISTKIFAELSPEESLKKLIEGNKRFVSGKSIRPNQSEIKIKELAKGQKPFAVIVGCSDSRVPNEIIFDQGLGDLFVIRTAGQVSSYASWGSMEFASAVLGAKLIVVLGHTKCGAVAAACTVPDVPGHIVTLINAIKPAAELAKDRKGDHIENTVKVNVAMQVESLSKLEPVLSKRYTNKEIKIIGAVYDLETGKVEFLPEDFLSKFKKDL